MRNKNVAGAMALAVLSTQFFGNTIVNADDDLSSLFSDLNKDLPVTTKGVDLNQTNTSKSKVAEQLKVLNKTDFADGGLKRYKAANVLLKCAGKLDTDPADISSYVDIMGDDYIKDTLSKAVAAGIMVGYKTQLRPEDNITQAELIKMCVISLGVKEGDLSNTQGSTKWYDKYMVKAGELNLLPEGFDTTQGDKAVDYDTAISVLSNTLISNDAAGNLLAKNIDPKYNPDAVVNTDGPITTDDNTEPKDDDTTSNITYSKPADTTNLESAVATAVYDKSTIRLIFPEEIKDTKRVLVDKLQLISATGDLKGVSVTKIDKNIAFVKLSGEQVNGAEYSVLYNNKFVGAIKGTNIIDEEGIAVAKDIIVSSIEREDKSTVQFATYGNNLAMSTEGTIGKKLTVTVLATPNSVLKYSTSAVDTRTTKVDATGKFILAVSNDKAGIQDLSFEANGIQKRGIRVYWSNDGEALKITQLRTNISNITSEANSYINNTRVMYKVHVKSPSNGTAFGKVTVGVALRESLDGTVRLSNNLFDMQGTKSVDGKYLSLRTDENGDAFFTVTGVGKKVTPVVFIDDLNFYKNSGFGYTADGYEYGNSSFDGTELYKDLDSVNFVSEKGTLSTTNSANAIVYTGDDKGRSYDVTALDSKGKELSNSWVNVSIAELTKGIDTAKARILSVNDDNTFSTRCSVNEKDYLGIKVVKVQTDEKGKLKFTLGHGLDGTNVTPVVWVDSDATSLTAGNGNGVLDTNDLQLNLGKIYFSKAPASGTVVYAGLDSSGKPEATSTVGKNSINEIKYKWINSNEFPDNSVSNLVTGNVMATFKNTGTASVTLKAPKGIYLKADANGSHPFNIYRLDSANNILNGVQKDWASDVTLAPGDSIMIYATKLPDANTQITDGVSTYTDGVSFPVFSAVKGGILEASIRSDVSVGFLENNSVVIAPDSDKRCILTIGDVTSTAITPADDQDYYGAISAVDPVNGTVKLDIGGNKTINVDVRRLLKSENALSISDNNLKLGTKGLADTVASSSFVNLKNINDSNIKPGYKAANYLRNGNVLRVKYNSGLLQNMDLGYDVTKDYLETGYKEWQNAIDAYTVTGAGTLHYTTMTGTDSDKDVYTSVDKVTLTFDKDVTIDGVNAGDFQIIDWLNKQHKATGISQPTSKSVQFMFDNDPELALGKKLKYSYSPINDAQNNSSIRSVDESVYMPVASEAFAILPNVDVVRTDRDGNIEGYQSSGNINITVSDTNGSQDSIAIQNVDCEGDLVVTSPKDDITIGANVNVKGKIIINDVPANSLWLKNTSPINELQVKDSNGITIHAGAAQAAVKTISIATAGNVNLKGDLKGANVDISTTGASVNLTSVLHANINVKAASVNITGARDTSVSVNPDTAVAGTLKDSSVIVDVGNGDVAGSVYKVSSSNVISGQKYAIGTVVNLSTKTQGAKIYYTTNGSAPTTSSTIYDATTGIKLTEPTTVKAVASLGGYTDSELLTLNLDIEDTKLDKPVSSAASNVYVANGDTISLAGTGVKYTIDGSDPATSQTAVSYTRPIQISSLVGWVNNRIAIKAVSTSDKYWLKPSDQTVVNATYKIVDLNKRCVTSSVTGITTINIPAEYLDTVVKVNGTDSKISDLLTLLNATVATNSDSTITVTIPQDLVGATIDINGTSGSLSAKSLATVDLTKDASVIIKGIPVAIKANTFK